MSSPNDMVYYCVYDKTTGVVTNAGFCPRNHVAMQRRSAAEDVLITSDNSPDLSLERCRHEEIKLGYVVGYTQKNDSVLVHIGHARTIAQSKNITPGKAAS